MTSALHHKPRRSVVTERRPFRADVQALRAIAVTAVVLNHFFPGRLPGGYIGVDVFFVISGFLITGHLLREIETTGRVQFARFYARRARRLLPAALLVLAVSAVAVWLFLPYTRWQDNAVLIAASAGYVANWVLTAQSVDYSAHNSAATIAQHYWSLSVEEQFYLVWPLILMAGGVWLWRRAGTSLRLKVALVVAVIGAASFVSSIVFTVMWPQQAYFLTFTRGWEFAVGAAIALVPAAAFRGKVLVCIAGLVAIGAAAVLYSPLTPFPGYAAALPVLGTAAVIFAGPGYETSSVAARVLGFKPVQWLGDISYSLYLWHWPVLVIMPFVISATLSGVTALAAIAISILLAWLTRKYVEVPGQRPRWWSRTSRAVAISTITAMAVVCALALSLALAGRAAVKQDGPDAALPAGECVGPAALTTAGCDPFGKPVESAVMTPANEYFLTPPTCGEHPVDSLTYGTTQTTHICDFSGGKDGLRVWLVGDSHAEQWQGAIYDLAMANGWKVTISYLGGCPPADVPFVGFNQPAGADDIERCRTWSRDVADAIEKDAPDYVITSMAAREQLLQEQPGLTKTDQFVQGLHTYWDRWTAAGSQVIVIADPPRNGTVRPQDCLLLNPGNPRECARPRIEAASEDPVLEAGRRSTNPNVSVLDLTDKFCDANNCYAAVGGVPVYYDPDHLNRVYVRMLAPDIEAALSGRTDSMG